MEQLRAAEYRARQVAQQMNTEKGPGQEGGDQGTGQGAGDQGRGQGTGDQGREIEQE